METETIDRAAEIAALGLTVAAVFIPFSRSRNKDEKSPSLNWRVTIKRNGREIISTDYGAGYGHCPAKATKAPATYQGKDRRRMDGTPYPGTTSSYRRPTEAERLAEYLADWRAAECESGLAMEHDPFRGNADFKPKRDRKPILPDTLDVIYSLNSDADALNYASFEDWADSFGYDADSRSAEATYRACLEIGLKLRAALGGAGLERLNVIFQDY